MSENITYKGIAQTFETRYVIMEFDPSNLRYPVSMTTDRKFRSPLEAQEYLEAMNWNTPSRMIVPVVVCHYEGMEKAVN